MVAKGEVVALAPALAVMKVTHDDAGGNDTPTRPERGGIGGL